MRKRPELFDGYEKPKGRNIKATKIETERNEKKKICKKLRLKT